MRDDRSVRLQPDQRGSARSAVIAVFRKDLVALLQNGPRSVSSLARELGLRKNDVEDDLRHLIRSARAAGRRVLIQPACCRSCGFTFDEKKLSKPGKCPRCRGSRILEGQISITQHEWRAFSCYCVLALLRSCVLAFKRLLPLKSSRPAVSRDPVLDLESATCRKCFRVSVERSRR